MRISAASIETIPTKPDEIEDLPLVELLELADEVEVVLGAVVGVLVEVMEVEVLLV